MQQFEDGFTSGSVSNASAAILSIAMGLAAFGVGIAIFLAAVIGFRWIF